MMTLGQYNGYLISLDSRTDIYLHSREPQEIGWPTEVCQSIVLVWSKPSLAKISFDNKVPISKLAIFANHV
jgi:hypothetical protein